jgi:hypothetical protein
VTEWTPVFLGVIAVAVAIMAAIQVGALIYGARLAQRVSRLADQVEQEVKPVFAHVQAIGAEAARASVLAAQQVERADRLFADVSQRLEETVTIVQSAVITPARESMAIVAAIKAVLATIRGTPSGVSRIPRNEEEESLFIG